MSHRSVSPYARGGSGKQSRGKHGSGKRPISQGPSASESTTPILKKASSDTRKESSRSSVADDDESSSNSPEMKAFWHSPTRKALTSGQGVVPSTPSSSSIASAPPGSSGVGKIKGFLRHWKDSRDDGNRAKAQAVVTDILRVYSGAEEAPPVATGGGETSLLSADQTVLLQGFVKSLQQLTQHQHQQNQQQQQQQSSSPCSTPPVVAAPEPVGRRLPFTPSPVLTRRAASPPPPIVAPPPQQTSPQKSSQALEEDALLAKSRKKEEFVAMVEKEMGEIMALCDAGVFNLDDDSLPGAMDANDNAQQQQQPQQPQQQQPPPVAPTPPLPPPPPQTPKVEERQSVIDGELLALDALIASGWWDQPPSASKRPRTQPQPVVAEELPPLYWRLRVLEHGWSSYEDVDGVVRQQRVLHCVVADTDEVRVLLLRMDWIVPENPIETGDLIHFIGHFQPDNCAVVDRDNNYVVINPDKLIRVTSIGNAISCLRRSVLEEKLKIHSDALDMVLGTMVHALFEACICNNDFSDSFALEQMYKIIEKFLERLYAVKYSEEQALKHMQQSFPKLKQWSQKFLKASDQPVSFEDTTQPSRLVKVCKVLGAEQSVWCPMWGMTGKIDLCLEVKFDGSDEPVVCPVELKTGQADKGQISHRAQVIMYTLLLSQVYRSDIQNGLLFYTENSSTIGVAASRSHIVALVQQRNAIAYHLTHPRLPPLKREARFCGSCSQMNVCMLLHKSVERGTDQSSGVPELFNSSTSHLTQAELQFYIKWDRLNRLESGADDEKRAEIWSVSGNVREQAGRCFSGMVISREGVAGTRGKRSTFVTFERSKKTSPSQVRLTDIGLQVGERVVMSTEDGVFGVMVGHIVQLSDAFVVVDTTGPFAFPPVKVKNQWHPIVDIEDIGKENKQQHQANLHAALDNVLWRIDIDPVSSGYGFVNQNLAALMAPSQKKLRSLVVGLKEPEFIAGDRFSQEEEQLTDPLEASLWKRMRSALNVYQLRAVYNALSATDYALVLGVPGSGKTATMAWTVAAMVQRGRSVLISGFTHAAVDSLLRKLLELKVPFIRLAPSAANVHVDVRPFVITSGSSGLKTVKEIQDKLEQCPVVAVTCLGVKHGLFERRRFDCCIVDEASQISLPAVLGPLRFADRFILVGDHYQLPPLVSHVQARDEGLGLSLFNALSTAHPRAVTMLEFQYRMNADIMSICNTLVYNNKLRCGNEVVARSHLKVEGAHTIRPTWLRLACAPERRVVLLDTDQASIGEAISARDKLFNLGEAQVVTRIAKALIEIGKVDPRTIGVISPYRAQVHTLEDFFRSCGLQGVEVNTVDRCQGRDWDVILVSLVRSNDNMVTGEVLTDWRRLNVAFSRAKKKLIMIGDQATLHVIPAMKEVFQLCCRNGWTVQLPSDWQNEQ